MLTASIFEKSRYHEWNVAKKWLTHESKFKISNCLDKIRRLNPTRANDVKQWKKVGKALHILSSSQKTFLNDSQNIVENIFKMYRIEKEAEEKNNSFNQDNDDDDNDDDDDDDDESDIIEEKEEKKNAPYELFVAWTMSSEKWERLKTLGFDANEVTNMCTEQWNLYDKQNLDLENYKKEQNNISGILHLPPTTTPSHLPHSSHPSHSSHPTTSSNATETSFFQLESLNNTIENEAHPMILWSTAANIYMTELLNVENKLRDMLNKDIDVHRKNENKRRVPTIVVLEKTHATVQLSWWNNDTNDEPWSPMKHTVYQVHLYAPTNQVDSTLIMGVNSIGGGGDDVNNLKNYILVYSGVGSKCVLKNLIENTEYVVRIKSICTPPSVNTSDSTKKKIKSYSAMVDTDSFYYFVVCTDACTCCETNCSWKKISCS